MFETDTMFCSKANKSCQTFKVFSLQHDYFCLLLTISLRTCSVAKQDFPSVGQMSKC